MSDKFAGVLCKKLSLKARDGGISSALIMSRKMEAGCSGNVVQTKNTSNYAGQKKKWLYIYSEFLIGSIRIRRRYIKNSQESRFAPGLIQFKGLNLWKLRPNRAHILSGLSSGCSCTCQSQSQSTTAKSGSPGLRSGDPGPRTPETRPDSTFIGARKFQHGRQRLAQIYFIYSGQKGKAVCRLAPPLI